MFTTKIANFLYIWLCLSPHLSKVYGSLPFTYSNSDSNTKLLLISTNIHRYDFENLTNYSDCTSIETISSIRENISNVNKVIENNSFPELEIIKSSLMSSHSIFFTISHLLVEDFNSFQEENNSQLVSTLLDLIKTYFDTNVKLYHLISHYYINANKSKDNEEVFDVNHAIYLKNRYVNFGIQCSDCNLVFSFIKYLMITIKKSVLNPLILEYKCDAFQIILTNTDNVFENSDKRVKPFLSYRSEDINRKSYIAAKVKTNDILFIQDFVINTDMIYFEAEGKEVHHSMPKSTVKSLFNSKSLNCDKKNMTQEISFYESEVTIIEIPLKSRENCKYSIGFALSSKENLDLIITATFHLTKFLDFTNHSKTRWKYKLKPNLNSWLFHFNVPKKTKNSFVYIGIMSLSSITEDIRRYNYYERKLFKREKLNTITTTFGILSCLEFTSQEWTTNGCELVNVTNLMNTTLPQIECSCVSSSNNLSIAASILPFTEENGLKFSRKTFIGWKSMNAFFAILIFALTSILLLWTKWSDSSQLKRCYQKRSAANVYLRGLEDDVVLMVWANFKANKNPFIRIIIELIYNNGNQSQRIVLPSIQIEKGLLIYTFELKAIEFTVNLSQIKVITNSTNSWYFKEIEIYQRFRNKSANIEQWISGEYTVNLKTTTNISKTDYFCQWFRRYFISYSILLSVFLKDQSTLITQTQRLSFEFLYLLIYNYFLVRSELIYSQILILTFALINYYSNTCSYDRIHGNCSAETRFRKPILNFIIGIFWLFLTLYDWRIYLDSKREVIVSKYILDLISSLTIVEMSCSALFGFIDAIGDTFSRNFDPGWRVKPVSQTIQTVFKIPNS